MTQFLGIFIVLLTVTGAFGQRELNNTKTDRHQYVNGTKCSLIPPTGLVAATNFKGFRSLNNEIQCAVVLEEQSVAFEIAAASSEESLKKQDLMLKKREEVKINGLKGVLFVTEQLSNGVNMKSYSLLFGDEKTTVIVSGAFPAESKELDQKVLESIQSIVYEPNLIVDPLSTVPYSISTEGTRLKFGKQLPNMLLYSIDGKAPSTSQDQTGLSVIYDPTVVAVPERKSFALKAVKDMPLKDLQLDENKVQEIEVDGMSGYEIVAEGQARDGRTELVYVTMLYSDTACYLILGKTKGAYEENLVAFKKIARTLKRK